MPAAVARRFGLSTRVVGGRATAWLYGGIGQDLDGHGGVNARSLKRELDGLRVSAATLRINSPGGLLTDSLALYDAVRRLAARARVTARVDSLAGSGASLVAMACSEIVVAPGARFYVHDPVTDVAAMAADGYRPDRRVMAVVVEDEAQRCAEIYAERSGGSVALWRARMSANGGQGMWFNARQAIAVGLADRIG